MQILQSRKDKVTEDWFSFYSPLSSLPVFFNEEIEEKLLNAFLDDYVNYVFQEFPQMNMKGFYYDIPHTWSTWLDTYKNAEKIPQIIKEIAEEYIDPAFALEEFENWIVSECVDAYRLDCWLEEFNLTQKEEKFIRSLFNDGGSAHGDDFKIRNVNYVDVVEHYSEFLKATDFNQYKNPDDVLYIEMTVMNYDWVATFDKKSLETILNKKIGRRRR